MTTDVDVTARLPVPPPAAEADPTQQLDARALRRAERRLTRGGRADIVYVLCLVQVAFTLLAAVGEQLLMGGNPAFLVVPAVKSVLLLVVAAKVVSGRRWALITLIVLQAMTLTGFWLQFVASLLPTLGLTVNLVGLVTNVALPATMVVLCGQMLFHSGRRSEGGAG